MGRSSIEGLERVVIWQPNTGFVTDIGGGQAKAAALGTAREEYYTTRQGQRARTRTRPFTMPLIDVPLAEHLRTIRNIGCPVRMAGLGYYPVMWQELSLLNLTTERTQRGDYAPEHLILENSKFYPAIGDSDNLLGFAPWACTEAQPYGDDGMSGPEGYRLEHAGLPGYGGPFWEVEDPDATVDGCGMLSELSAGRATLTFEFPLGGAVLFQRGFNGFTEALDWDGNVLGNTGSTGFLHLPFFTWSIRVQVNASSQAPRLEVVDVGLPLSPRCGTYLPCDERADAPPWTIWTFTFDPENLLPSPEPDFTFDAENLVPGQSSGEFQLDAENLVPTPTGTVSDFTFDPQNLIIQQ